MWNAIWQGSTLAFSLWNNLIKIKTFIFILKLASTWILLQASTAIQQQSYVAFRGIVEVILLALGIFSYNVCVFFNIFIK